MKPLFWITLATAALLATVAFLSWPRRPPDGKEDATEEEVATAIRFEDVTARAGIDFVHFDSATPMHYILETMGSGVAFIDYDNDGWLDVFCIQVGPVLPGEGKPRPTPRLYRNNGDGTFTDVTKKVGLDHPGYGMGCAVGDFDNDGYDDLVVTYFGEIRLYHNEPAPGGGRRFVDVTEKAGLRNPHWGTSCAWGDIDGDGFLDLYVCNYVEIDLQKYTPCVHAKLKERYLCPPRVFPATTHKLWKNNGGRTFTDISKESGIATVPPAPGLAVALCDLDDDGKVDIYVANDMMPAYLFHNQGGGKFVETAQLAGCGLQANGRYLAGMGIALGDFDRSARPSLFVTNYQDEPNNLFLNKGKLTFFDATHTSGLGPPSVPYLAFGTVLFDADLDGLPEVAVANGHVLRNAEKIDGAPSKQNAQLFQGTEPGKFREVTAGVGPYFRRKLFGRGVAWGDFDNDGRPDLLFSHNGGPVVLLRNVTRTDNRWVRLELIGAKKSNRNAIGARVEIEYPGGRQVQWVSGGGSYLSASDRRLLFGLGKADRVTRVQIRWPSGQQQEFGDLAAGSWYRLHEEKARPEKVVPRR
jgi:hypothetical protein